MENNILKSVYSKNRCVSSVNIIESSTEELVRYNKKATVLVLSQVGHNKECSECLFEDHGLTEYIVFYLLGSCGTRQD